MRIIYSAEFLFAVSILLFSGSLLISGLIVKKLLKLVLGRRAREEEHSNKNAVGGIWVLLIIGSISLILGSIVHFIKLFGFMPQLAHAEPYDILPLLLTSMKMGTIESLTVLIAGILAFTGGFIYYLLIKN